MKEWLGALNSSDTEKFYDSKYKHSGKGAFKGYDWSFFFPLLEQFFGKLRPTDTLLDCGCGHGEFIETVISKYKFSSPFMTGIDVSSEALCLAEDRFKNYEFDFNFQKVEMEQIHSYWSEAFDIITSWGSIEHSIDPLESLRRMLRSCKLGGFVFITVPLEFEGCLSGIENEEFQNNNERFMTSLEWINYFRQVKKPIYTKIVPEIDQNDILLIFRR